MIIVLIGSFIRFIIYCFIIVEFECVGLYM